MKDKMEHKIQDLLQNQELPYNSAAWDNMKQALDTKMPVTQPTNWYKWFLGGAAITVIAVSTYFFIQKDSSNSTQSTSSPKIEKQIQPANQEKVSTTQNTSEKSNLSPITSKSSEKTDLSQTDNKLTASTNDDVTKMTSILEQSILVEEVVMDQTDLDPISSKKEITDIVTTNQKEELTTNSTLITAVNMCLGERQLLENKNDFAVSVFKQNSNQLIATIEAKKSMSFEAKEQGTYLLIEKNKPVIEGTNSFEVKNSPKPTLEIENEIRYEKGVPTLKASTDVTNSVQWTINNLELNSTKSELDFNPFKAGTYSVSVKTLTEGCIVSQTSKVNIDEDYNLLAVNAFNPNSFEPRNQTFIPFALTQRDVKFTLLILDPKDGGVMYQTEDASQPWNGIDKRTGQLAPSNQAYIWKVRIANPLPGESTEYKGTITKL
ncbi:MAG: hypothetical protein K9G36_07605 [Crocinitomicaceae bacterium]|nr:hypothetical protein [Crocinitomicaceae bacterium]MCF8411170.1 hypothetical protein [Crocinitomicaceae bacterium]MCF8444678.1 hypothetical protein [Crocinitomicaceae bacterium]